MSCDDSRMKAASSFSDVLGGRVDVAAVDVAAEPVPGAREVGMSLRCDGSVSSTASAHLAAARFTDGARWLLSTFLQPRSVVLIKRTERGSVLLLCGQRVCTLGFSVLDGRPTDGSEGTTATIS